MTLKEVQDNPHKAHTLYDAVKQNIMLYDSTGKDMPWVESVCKSYKPDIVVLDMGDKFANFGGFSRPDEALKANAIYARQIAKEYGCAIFYMSQLNAEAEGRVNLDQSMMEGSRTGKAAEADLMILIAKSPQTSNNNSDAEVAEDDGFRHLVLAKNKLTGWHGRIVCEFNYLTGRYEA
jgi:RecA-family ATPase